VDESGENCGEVVILIERERRTERKENTDGVPDGMDLQVDE
jgi:hypothetical protein